MDHVHVCACSNCDPSLALSPKRLSPEHHNGTNDDYVTVDGKPRLVRGSVTVLLDGEDVTRVCTEFTGGEDGWVLLLGEVTGDVKPGHSRFHYCRNCDAAHRRGDSGGTADVCRERRTGRVEWRLKDTVKA